MLCLRCT